MAWLRLRFVLDFANVHYVTGLKAHLDIECIHAIYLNSISILTLREVCICTVLFYIHYPLAVATQVSYYKLVISFQSDTVNQVLFATLSVCFFKSYCLQGIRAVYDKAIRTILARSYAVALADSVTDINFVFTGFHLDVQVEATR